MWRELDNAYRYAVVCVKKDAVIMDELSIMMDPFFDHGSSVREKKVNWKFHSCSLPLFGLMVILC